MEENKYSETDVKQYMDKLQGIRKIYEQSRGSMSDIYKKLNEFVDGKVYDFYSENINLYLNNLKNFSEEDKEKIVKENIHAQRMLDEYNIFEEDDVIKLIKSLANEDYKLKLFEEYGITLSDRYDSLKIANESIDDSEIKYKVYNRLIEAKDHVEWDSYECDDIGFLLLDEDLNIVSKILNENDDSLYLTDRICSLPDSEYILRGTDMEERIELLQNYLDRYVERHGELFYVGIEYNSKVEDTGVGPEKLDLASELIAVRDEKIKSNQEQIEDKKETVNKLNWKSKLAEQESILLAQENEIADLDKQIADMSKDQK